MDNTVDAIETIINKLSKNELTVTCIPKEYDKDVRLVSYERKAGLRVAKRRGYDVISNSFFVEDTLIIANQDSARTKWYYFDSFDDYYKHLCGDIYENACYAFFDLDNETVIRHKLDRNRLFKRQAFIEYTINDYTLEKLNPDVKEQNLTDTHYQIKKEYIREEFLVQQTWKDNSGKVLQYDCQRFLFFFDFVFFLKGDLSNADLITCDGLANLSKKCKIDFSGAKLTSSLCDKFAVDYKRCDFKTELLRTFESTSTNELETIDIRKRKIIFSDENEVGYGSKRRIYYVSDIHLLHKAKKNGAKSREDCIYIARKIAECIVQQAKNENLVLIGGDVTSDFELFICFISHLSSIKSNYMDIVFILGNHELWGFPNNTFGETISLYRTIIASYGMYFLQNDLLYIETPGNSLFFGRKKINIIPYSELEKLDDNQISDLLKKAHCVILGGMGFSGYNAEFNADNYIYRKSISRLEEIKETYKFEALYNRLKAIMPFNNTIIMTHMPKKDWCSIKEYDNHFIYVSGHTHRNVFFDDGVTRVYSDNQIGYYAKEVHLKHFVFNYEYDYFYNYKDGVHVITREQYREFIKGKNISMTFNRKNINILYMLKKNGYYCFIHESTNGKLAILNGGAMKNLPYNDIYYYYNNMDAVISGIEKPMANYTNIQKNISCAIKGLGGIGFIHGSIIDIDFYNHIFLNPIDGKMTCYWASDIINKVVYPSLSSLLQDKNPQLLSNYNMMIRNAAENFLSLYEREAVLDNAPQITLDTDIYRASRTISKMQKLKKNILNIWPENTSQKEVGRPALPLGNN